MSYPMTRIIAIVVIAIIDNIIFSYVNNSDIETIFWRAFGLTLFVWAVGLIISMILERV